MSYLLALDQGTTSSRAIVFDPAGRIVAQAQQEFAQHFPLPGWVEHDPMAIWHSQRDIARQAVSQAGIAARDVRGIGITNQRETTVLWHRQTGRPLHPAIVWQDRRTEALCQRLREEGLEPGIRARTGLVLDPYFSGTKLAWLLEHVPGARAQAEAGELAFGTIDSWLLWQLTDGQVHATDVSNASRTLLWDIHQQRWDEPMLARLRIPHSLLPKVCPSAHLYGQTAAGVFDQSIPIGALVGDQQAALFGQGCIEPGMAKNTYGTGCFMLMHTGSQAQLSGHGLLSTCAAQIESSPRYALEGSVFMGGAVVQWLRDGLGIIRSSHEVQALAESVPDSGGVMVVPAFTGLGAPYWDAQARGAILGLTRGSTAAHIARAALESIAYQSAAVLQAMSQDTLAQGGVPLKELRVDGGASRNDLLMQFQADLLGIPVLRPSLIETTAWGAAALAGISVGIYGVELPQPSLSDDMTVFEPQARPDDARARMSRWEQAVRQARHTATTPT